MIPVKNTYCGKVHFKPSLYVLAQMRINSEVTLIQKYTVPQDLAVESRKWAVYWHDNAPMHDYLPLGGSMLFRNFQRLTAALTTIKLVWGIIAYCQWSNSEMTHRTHSPAPIWIILRVIWLETPHILNINFGLSDLHTPPWDSYKTYVIYRDCLPSQ